MAKGKVMARPSVEANLEQLDLVIEPRSVVLSVRLDAPTARQLGAIARREKRRVSDVLRDAAAAYVREPESQNIVVTSFDNTFRVGVAPTTYAPATGEVKLIGRTAETLSSYVVGRVVQATRIGASVE